MSLSMLTKARFWLCWRPSSSRPCTPSRVRPLASSRRGRAACGPGGGGGWELGWRMTCTLEPPKPKELMPTMPPRTGRGRSTTCSRPSCSAGILGFGLWKCRLGAQSPCSRDSSTLASAASPEAGSGCPMFDLVDPISRGPWRLPHRACTMPFSSSGSPTLVPVPWASMYSRVSGSSPAGLYRELMSCSCASPEGYVTPCFLQPSVLVPALRMVAYTRRAKDFLVRKTAITASARQ